MNKTKKPLLLLIISALLLSSLLLLVGCGGDSGEISEIFISKSSTHKKVYIKGEELDLSGGVITTVTDGKEGSVPMNADGVSVTGYNPELLGKQTLTLTYKDKTTTFAVEVVARAVAEGYETDYFVEETFNSQKGKIKIRRDNGSILTVNMNSSQVSLKSFDSSVAGTTEVTVICTEGATEYECSFTVNVHEVADVSFKAPYKTEYKSHETELDLTGSYLKVTAAAPSNLTKYVDITKSMYSGYDPAAATVENVDTPLPQTVTVSYGGKTFTFGVTVLYSGVYLVADAAKDLASIDWEVDNPIVDDRQATLAINAMISYFNLSDYEKTLVLESDVYTVLRPAVVSLYGRYLNESVSFKDAFVITAQGSIDITGTSPEGVKSALDRLLDEKDVFNSYASLAEKIREEFGNKTLKDNVTVKSYLITHSSAEIEQLQSIFEFMLEIHEHFKTIPSDWTVDDLKGFSDEILFATSDILTSGYATPQYSQLYYSVSEWRGGDYLDIIYSYYYNVKENGREEIRNSLWGRIPAPGMLAEWYNTFRSAVYEVQLMEYQLNYGAYLYDTAGFMYYYATLLELSDKVLAEGSALDRGIYELVECEKAITLYLRSATYGYIFQMGEALDYDKVVKLWANYVNLIDLVMKNTEGGYSKFGSEIEALFNEVMALSPAELHAFLSSMNFLYETSAGTVLVLQHDTMVYNMMTYVLASYYGEVLPEKMIPAFRSLLIAAENLSLIGVKSDALSAFISSMGEVNAVYKSLSGDEITTFERYLGGAYSRYLGYLDSATSEGGANLGGMDASFNELNSLLDEFDRIFTIISTTENADELSKLVPLALALYQKIELVRNEIALSDNNTAINALYTKVYEKSGVIYTLDARYLGARNVIVRVLIASGVADASGNSMMSWDAYVMASDKVKEFMVKVLPLLLKEQAGEVYEGDIYALINEFRALKSEDQLAVYMLGINNLYYAAIERYTNDKLSDANKVDGLVNKILHLEIAYVVYQGNSSEDNLAALKSAADEVTKLTNELTDTDNRDEYLAPLYEQYLKIIESL